MSQTWRQYYAPQIDAIIKENLDKPKSEIRRILYKANPGPYKHQRKVWSDESLKQLGLKAREKPKRPAKDLTNQLNLFGNG
jgi:hypothetical protein